ncbi:MAG: OmpA family protein [Deltaproteobacteria bacterium]|nr:OmpA family protein [Deltaproteobacteria bacterium]
MERAWRGVFCAAAGAFVLLGASMVQAGEPYFGVDLGAAGPTEKFRRTADVGGSIAGHLGYRLLKLGNNFAFSLEGVPQFAGFQIKPGVSTKGRDVESIFSITAGPRLSLLDENLEIYISGGGGYYRHTTGVVDDDGGGWDIAGGINYECMPNHALGFFVRRDEAKMRPFKGPTDEHTSYVTGGLSYEHRFRPAVAVVAEAAPPPPPPAAAPAAPPIKKKLVLRGVNFDYNKSNIRNDAKPILDEAAATLKEESNVNISVEGHTDSRGTDAYNQKLSERRAKSVADYLSAHGIATSRLSTVGYGESRPVAGNDSDEGRAQNRRVELRVQE